MTRSDVIRFALHGETGLPVDTGVPIAPYTTLKIGGPADFFMKAPNGESLGRILPVKTLAKLYGDFISEGALRALIWSAEAYEKDPKPGLRSNGFLPVIVRPPNQRKVLLDRVEFEKWLTSQQRTAR
ncbi:MAG: hypothetical protein EBZ89_00140 [Chloroflexi bacterium]|nr:hypothetical protein [Chloroflexota bacterium]